MWRRHLSPRLQIPLINADRLLLAILPEPGSDGFLPEWAAALRDGDASWLAIAQRGVQSFIGHALAEKAPFALETVFSDWRVQPDGSVASKIDLIRELQTAGYFVLLIFVGLTSEALSSSRVATRVGSGGHAVPDEKLRQRFPRTQRAISQARAVADATILVDNSLSEDRAFTVCLVQYGETVSYDIRRAALTVPRAISRWLDIIAPPAG
jgi:predicted ABC-type ATPase